MEAFDPSLPGGTEPRAARAEGILIDEVVPGNIDLLDEDGDDPGWTEIVNAADAAARLSGWSLGDGKGGFWAFPDTILPPGGRLLVFLSGKDRAVSRDGTDSLDLFQGGVACGSDADVHASGRSRCTPWDKPELVGPWGEGGRRAVFAEIIQGRDSSTAMAGSYAGLLVTASVPDGALDGLDRLEVRVMVSAGREMEVRFCQDGIGCNSSRPLRFRGTGRLETMVLPLARAGIDPSRVQALVVSPPANVAGIWRIQLEGLVARRGPRRPHANFKLDRDGGILRLMDDSGRVRHLVRYPALQVGRSWSRLPGTTAFAEADSSTPGADFRPAEELRLPAPTFLTKGGFHEDPVVVRFAGVPEGVVRCRDAAGSAWDGWRDVSDGIRLDSTMALSCATFDGQGRGGPVASELFLVGDPTRLPVVSLVVDPIGFGDSARGIYASGPEASPDLPHYGANYWKDTAIAADVAMYGRGRGREWSSPAGLSIHGSASRVRAKKAMEVSFSERFGARDLRAELLPGRADWKRFSGFILRNSGSSCGLDHVRDVLGASLAERMDLESPAARFVTVFVNGRYWGIHDLRERIDDGFLERRGVRTGVDLLEDSWQVKAGTASEWADLVAWFRGADPLDPDFPEDVQERIDVDAVGDYFGAEFWSANCDWPDRNSAFWRPRTEEARWRPILRDLDAGMSACGNVNRLLDLGTPARNDPNSFLPVLFRKLAAIPAWRNRMLGRMSVRLSRELSSAVSVAVYDSLLGVVAFDAPRDKQRWNFSEENFLLADRRIREFLETRTTTYRRHLRTWFQLGALVRMELVGTGGRFVVEGLDVGNAYRGDHFAGVPVRIRAVSVPGASFAGWRDGVAEPERIVTPSESGLFLEARFEDSAE